MIFLGAYKAGTLVKYRSNFHNDTGTIENPTAPEAQREDPAGTFTALTAPAIINAKVGHYGGSVDTTGFAAGLHFIRMAGTVATAKVVATEFCFQIVAYDPADAAGLGLSRLDAAVTSRMATYTQPAGFLAATFPTGTISNTTNITTATGVTVSTVNDKTGYALTTGERTSIADATLNRDMSAATDTSARSPLKALRKLMNRIANSGTVLTVYKEDDTTASFTQAVTESSTRNPIQELDTV